MPACACDSDLSAEASSAEAAAATVAEAGLCWVELGVACAGTWVAGRAGEDFWGLPEEAAGLLGFEAQRREGLGLQAAHARPALFC